MGDPPATIANPKLAELQQALHQAQGVSTSCGTCLEDLRSAMTAKAWVSSAGDAFSTQITAQQKTATDAGTRCVDNVQAAIKSCPTQIPNPAAKAH